MKGEYDLPIYEHKDGLSVVPSCLDLSAVETELINEAGRELILAHLIKGQKEKFDYIPVSYTHLSFAAAFERRSNAPNTRCCSSSVMPVPGSSTISFSKPLS